MPLLLRTMPLYRRRLSRPPLNPLLLWQVQYQISRALWLRPGLRAQRGRTRPGQWPLQILPSRLLLPLSTIRHLLSALFHL